MEMLVPSKMGLVVDPRLELPVDSRLVATAGEAPLVVLCGPEARGELGAHLESGGARVLEVAVRPDGELVLPGVLEVLDRLGVTSVLVEGGGRLATSLLEEGLVQRQYLLLAPGTMGPDGVPAYDDRLASRFGEWKAGGRKVLGDDVLIELNSIEALAALREVP